MRFSHLFILQLKFWPRSLGPPNSDFRPDLFDLLILDLLIFDLQLFNFCISWPFMLEPILQTMQALQGNVTSWIVSGPRPIYFRNSQASNLFPSAEANIIIRVRLQQANHYITFQGGSIGPNNARLFMLQHYCRLFYSFYWYYKVDTLQHYIVVWAWHAPALPPRNERWRLKVRATWLQNS